MDFTMQVFDRVELHPLAQQPGPGPSQEPKKETTPKNLKESVFKTWIEPWKARVITNSGPSAFLCNVACSVLSSNARRIAGCVPNLQELAQEVAETSILVRDALTVARLLGRKGEMVLSQIPPPVRLTRLVFCTTARCDEGDLGGSLEGTHHSACLEFAAVLLLGAPSRKPRRARKQL